MRVVTTAPPTSARLLRIAQVDASPPMHHHTGVGAGTAASAVAPSSGRLDDSQYISVGVYHAGVASVTMSRGDLEDGRVDKVTAELQQLAQQFRNPGGTDGPSQAGPPVWLHVDDGKVPKWTEPKEAPRIHRKNTSVASAV